MEKRIEEVLYETTGSAPICSHPFRHKSVCHPDPVTSKVNKPSSSRIAWLRQRTPKSRSLQEARGPSASRALHNLTHEHDADEKNVDALFTLPQGMTGTGSGTGIGAGTTGASGCGSGSGAGGEGGGEGVFLRQPAMHLIIGSVSQKLDRQCTTLFQEWKCARQCWARAQ